MPKRHLISLHHIATLFPLLVLSLPAQKGDKSDGLAVPKRLIVLSDAITPREYGLLIGAIQTEMRKPAVARDLDVSPGLGDLRLITATRVHLGSLGEGAMVEFSHSPSCGNGGCNIWLFLRAQRGYRNLIRAAGWGFSLVRSGGDVPDVVFYWGMGAGETDVSEYRYANGMFAAFDSAKCLGESDRHGMCADLSSKGDDAKSLSPAEYDSLRQHGNLSVPARFEDAHAVDIGLMGGVNARIVGVGCTRHSNCTITVYGCKVTYPKATPANMGSIEASLPDCQYWTMLTAVRGWGVTNVSDFDSNPFSPRVALVIGRQLSSDRVELTRYTAVTDANGPKPGITLSPDACRLVTKPAIARSNKG
jgi:hypothetical protein